MPLKRALGFAAHETAGPDAHRGRMAGIGHMSGTYPGHNGQHKQRLGAFEPPAPPGGSWNTGHMVTAVLRRIPDGLLHRLGMELDIGIGEQEPCTAGMCRSQG